MRAFVLFLKKISSSLGFPDEFGRTFLFELQLFVVRLTWRFSAKNRRTLRRIRQGQDIRLNFGCGSVPLEGWINIDGTRNPKAELVIGLRGPLPLPSHSARFIFSEHLIEHFRHDEALVFLQECHRILEDGGVLRIVAPDLHGMARAYVEKDAAWFEKAFPYLDDPVDALNLIFHQGGAHHYIYDSEALQKILRKAGFEQVMPSTFGESAWPELNVDLDADLRTIKSVYVEAVKGAA